MPKGHHNNKRARRKPTSLKVLQGTYRQDQSNPAEPEPSRGVPEPLGCLSGAEQSVYRRIVGILDGMRVLTVADRDAVSRLAQDFCLVNEAKRQLDSKGWVLISSNGNSYKNPWATVYNEARKREAEGWIRFGLTPADRSRVKAAPEEPKEDRQSAWAEKLG
jgi:P27 family predicted phage terminase small subunit